MFDNGNLRITENKRQEVQHLTAVKSGEVGIQSCNTKRRLVPTSREATEPPPLPLGPTVNRDIQTGVDTRDAETEARIIKRSRNNQTTRNIE